MQNKLDPLSLAGMLAVPVTGQAITKCARSALQIAHLEANHKRNFTNALTKYRALLAGRGWLQTKQVEWLAGANATGSNVFLRKLKSLGYIENRPTGGTKTYIKNKGWDWRWIDGK